MTGPGSGACRNGATRAPSPARSIARTTTHGVTRQNSDDEVSMTDLIPRIRPAEVARITSLSILKVQEMAASGKIPGAAKFDGVWTFDPVQIKAWIHQRERAAACPMKDPYANAATSIPAAYVLPDESLNEAFERATTKK